MSTSCDRIRIHLEDEFDIPFTVHMEIVSGEREYIMGPSDSAMELFSIRARIRNGVRLNMDFVPQKYSRNFIAAMGAQKIPERLLFCQYVRAIQARGAVCHVLVNDAKLPMDAPETWPAVWEKFEARVSRMPASDDEDASEADIIDEWAGLMMGMILSLTDIVTTEDERQVVGFREGASVRYEANRYERNPINRKLCLDAYGYRCNVCGMDFEKVYGEIGHHFIHVHHIVPVSQLGADYMIDPVKDLIPVCPNCHAMLHRKDPPYLPDELRLIRKNTEDVTYSAD